MAVRDANGCLAESHDRIEVGRELPVYQEIVREIQAEFADRAVSDPRHLGAEIGFFSVLHTWSQQLNAHPHVHCVVPAGGLSPDHTRWVRSRENYFLPKEVLREIFRGKFVAALKQAP